MESTQLHQELSPQQRGLQGLQLPAAEHNALRVAQAQLLPGHEAGDRIWEALQTVLNRRCFPTMPDKGQGESMPVDRAVNLCRLHDTSLAQALDVLERQVPFHGEEGPVCHALLAHLSDGRHLLALSLFAFHADSRGCANTLQAVIDELHGRSDEETPEYGELAGWQNQLLESEDAEEGRTFWSQASWKNPSPPALAAACDAPFKPRHLVLPYLDLTHCAPSVETPNASAWLACWQLLLQQLCGVDGLTIGYVAEGREDESFEVSQGPFEKNLPLTLHSSPDQGFHDVLLRADKAAEHARDWQECFSWDDRDTNRPHYAFAARHYPGETVFRETITDRFHLLLELRDNPDELVLYYNANLYAEAGVRLIAQRLQTLAQTIAAHPHTCVSDLSGLCEAERKQIVQTFNRYQGDYPQDLCFHQLFENHVAAQPDAPAVFFETERITYAELDRHANQLAWYLRDYGIGPESLVGISMLRGPHMVVAVLAVMKAGGAYVPMDPSYPLNRLAFLLEDAQIELLLTFEEILDQLPSAELNFMPVICLDTDEEMIGAMPEEQPDTVSDPAGLAYMIYTSGTTGTPKGTMLSHGGWVNLALLQRRRFNVTRQSRVLQFASMSFDASTWELSMALGNGAALVMGNQANVMPGPALVQLIQEHGVTHATLPPTALRVMPSDDLTSLTHLISAGEALTPELRNQWMLGRSFFNAYGPTEATVCSTIQACDPDIPSHSIGRSNDNITNFVLDPYGHLVPIGDEGELYIGGAGLSRGYWQRPGLTAQRFLPNPYATTSGERLYRTGDLGRWTAEGNILYTGRIDHQVKLRGRRIEPGEIEARLRMLTDVRESVVLVRDDQLVAYVTGNNLDATVLRQALAEELPDYMVPAFIVVMDAFPLSGARKIDRAALPAPQPAGNTKEHVAPRNKKEADLVAIWSQLLNVAHIGINDNFFEIGGDSIIAIQICSRARRYGYVLQPNDLFDAPTPAQLAELAQDSDMSQSEQSAVTGLVPLTPIQSWFFETVTSDRAWYNQTLLLRYLEPLDLNLLEAATAALITQHDALRSRFLSQDGVWTQHVTDPEDEPARSYAIRIDVSQMQDPERQAFIEARAQDIQAGLSLEEGPLFRLIWFDCGPGEPARLMAVAHHLVMDNISRMVLMEDLASLLKQLREGDEPGLLPKTTSFKAWSEAIRTYADSSEGHAELAYWQRPQVTTPLTVDFPENLDRNTFANLAQSTLEFSEDDTRALLQEVPAAFRTEINDVLLCALAMAYAEETGGASLRVGMEGHGRENLTPEMDLSRTVGWFTAYFPVFLTLPKGNDVTAALKAVKEQMRTIPRHGVGYGMLRYASEEGRAVLGAQPNPEISFNYQGQVDRMLDMEGPFQGAPESAGPTQSPSQHRHTLWDFSAAVRNNHLYVTCYYPDPIFRETTVSRFMDRFFQALRSLITTCTAPGAGGLTPWDVPGARLSQESLDALLKRLDEDPRRIRDINPLSPLQQGMHYHSLLAPDSGVYVVQLHMELHGPLNTDAFRTAWETVIARHDVFRTFFIDLETPKPLQIVMDKAPSVWREEDWRDLEPKAQSQRLQTVLQEDRRQGFNPAERPLMRLMLFQTSDTVRHFVWTHHHSILDGWSTPVIMKDVLQAYFATAAGETITLPPVTPFSHYLRRLAKQDLGASEQYWRTYLAGFREPTPLPLGPTPVQTETMPDQVMPGKIVRTLNATQAESLRQLTRDYQITLNTLVLAAWGLVLYRYSGQSDLVFGTVTSGRPAELPGVETMVGPFINTLPVRMRIDEGTTLVDWLQSLQKDALERTANEHTTLMRIQKNSEVTGALFQSLVLFENYPVGEAAGEMAQEQELDIKHMEATEQTNYPVTVFVGAGKTLSIDLVYNRDLFREDAVVRAADLYLEVILGLATHIRSSVAAVMTEGDTTRRHHLATWNATTQPISPIPLHQQILARAAQHPKRTAVRCAGQEVSYGDLQRAVNQLAQALHARGVGLESRVGICIERGPEMVTALLAVLQTGAAYIPLDPDYPAARLDHIATDSNMALMVTAGTTPALQADVPTLDLHQQAEAISTMPTQPLAVSIAPANLAYIIYTSGSTGLPKGVAIGHESAVNLLDYFQTQLAPSTQDSWLAVTTIAFDIAMLELFLPLCHGARLCIATQEEQRDTQRLAALIDKEQPTLMQATPVTWQGLVDAGWSGLDTLTILSGGEALNRDLAAQLRTRGKRLLNVYGPTETTVWSSSLDCSAPNPYHLPAEPLGGPMANTTFYVLDDHLRPQPPGVPGAFYIGGKGLARGYWDKPALTAQKFIPDLFSETPGARLFHVGDQVRYLEDQVIEFLGRVDFQVKVRGFRIELGEIEARLRAHETVNQAVVVARPDKKGGRRLVAYIVTTECNELDRQQIRAWLLDTLPSYMVPSLFITLAAFPLTPNGKIDRRALPNPESVQHTGTEYHPPRTEAEHQLQTIWQDVLGLTHPIGIDEDFFTIGGDSMMVLQVIAAARARDLQLKPDTFLQNPTIEALAALTTPVVPTTRQELVTGDVPLHPVQIAALKRAQEEPHHYNWSFLWETPSTLDIARLTEAVHILVQHHDMLRARFTRTEDGWRQTLTEQVDPRFLHVETRIGNPETWEMQATDVQRRLNLEAGGLFKLVWFDFGADQPGRLLMVVHHLVTDAYSSNLLMQDLISLYTQGRSSLPAKTTAYADWTRRLQAYADELSTELPYWQTVAEKARQALPIPEHFDPKSARADQMTGHVCQLDTQATRALCDAQADGVYQALLTALGRALSQWLKRDHIAITLTSHGREHLFDDVDLSRTAGWFTTHYPVNLHLPENASMTDLLHRTRDQLAAVPHHGTGFPVLRYLHPDATVRESIAAGEQTGISFNYLGRQNRTHVGESHGFKPSQHTHGQSVSATIQAPVLLDVVAVIRDQQLCINMLYNREAFATQTIEDLSRRFLQALAAL